MNIEEGARLNHEARQRAEEEEQRIRMKADEEARLIEEARLKYEEEE